MKGCQRMPLCQVVGDDMMSRFTDSWTLRTHSIDVNELSLESSMRSLGSFGHGVVGGPRTSYYLPENVGLGCTRVTARI